MKNKKGVPQILKKKHKGEAMQPQHIYDNKILLEVDPYEQQLQCDNSQLYGYYAISADYETPCLINKVDFQLRRAEIVYYDKDFQNKYADTVSLNSVKLNTKIIE